MIAIIAILASSAYFIGVVIVLRKRSKRIAWLRSLVEQDKDLLAQMEAAFNAGNIDKWDRLCWRQQELVELIDRELEKAERL